MLGRRVFFARAKGQCRQSERARGATGMGRAETRTIAARPTWTPRRRKDQLQREQGQSGQTQGERV
eukprot:3237311-Lingulodinium_polyedra.AAC.1